MGFPPDGSGGAEPRDLADEPFSVQLVEDALRFVQARLAPLLVEEPLTAEQRMASLLAREAEIAAAHTRVTVRSVGLGEAGISWRRLADLAKLWADHSDFRKDFGRTMVDFPAPPATHARVVVYPGECDCEPDVAEHRSTLVPLTEWDLGRVLGAVEKLDEGFRDG